MSASDHPSFDSEFPESFEWGLIDSLRLSAVAARLVQEAQFQASLKPGARLMLPGLRYALNVIAQEASV